MPSLNTILKLAMLKIRLLFLKQVVGFGGQRNIPVESLQFSKLPFVDLEYCKKNVPDKLLVYTLLTDKFCVGVGNGKYVDCPLGLSKIENHKSWHSSKKMAMTIQFRVHGRFIPCCI